MSARTDLAPIHRFAADAESAGRLTPAVRTAVSKALRIRSGHDVVFYIAGALTGIDELLKLRYVQLHELIGDHGRLHGQAGRPDRIRMFGYAPHLHGTDPVRHPDVTPAEVRDIDYLFAALVPDYHINCLYPLAHGNAIEAGWAEAAGIPSLHLVPSGMHVSRLVRGMTNIMDVVVYDDFATDGLAGVRRNLDIIRRQASRRPARG